MIYAENFIFDMVADVLRAQYTDPPITVTGEYQGSSKSFPVVTIIQADSSEYMKRHTTAGEQAASVMYEVTVYSNVVGYKKLQAYNIMQTVDDVFTGKIVTEGRQMRFHRTMCSPIPNLRDSTIYALTARYEGVIDKEFVTYIN